ncbi:hypothetical protein IWX90DRAFT_416924 [Phyllosticta citrichinensis]|uniref:Uncharacterized protein n=1 Tax=Phyllosticta citrichinensis TaxID=1130410 RepID=A0ABR1XP04_9PEZI
MDDPTVARYAEIVQTGAYKGLEDGEPKSIIDMRLSCLLHETFIQTMMGSYLPDKPGSTREIFRKFCPWYEIGLEWLPTNARIPLKESFKFNGEAVVVDSELRAQIRRERMATRAYNARRAWSAQRIEHERETKRTLKEQITDLIAFMKNAGISDQEIEIWRCIASARRAAWLKLDPYIRPATPIFPPTALQLIDIRKRKERDDEEEEEEKCCVRKRKAAQHMEEVNSIRYGRDMNFLEIRYLGVTGMNDIGGRNNLFTFIYWDKSLCRLWISILCPLGSVVKRFTRTHAFNE